MNIKFPDNEIAQDENMIREYSNCLINQIKTNAMSKFIGDEDNKTNYLSLLDSKLNHRSLEFLKHNKQKEIRDKNDENRRKYEEKVIEIEKSKRRRKRGFLRKVVDFAVGAVTYPLEVLDIK